MSNGKGLVRMKYVKPVKPYDPYQGSRESLDGYAAGAMRLQRCQSWADLICAPRSVYLSLYFNTRIYFTQGNYLTLFLYSLQFLGINKLGSHNKSHDSAWVVVNDTTLFGYFAGEKVERETKIK